MPEQFTYSSKKCGAIVISQDQLDYTITTDRLRLLSLNQLDQKWLELALTQLLTEVDNIALYGTGMPWTASEIQAFITTEVERWQNDELFGVFAVLDRKTGQFMGNLHTQYVADQFAQVGGGHASVAEIGYILDKEFWGKGYGTELAICAKKYIKHVSAGISPPANIPKEIVATVHPANNGSKKILEKTLKNHEAEPIMKFNGQPRLLFFKPLKIADREAAVEQSNLSVSQ